MNYKDEFYNKLKKDKIKINWNKNPIKMKLFLSFLTVKVERSYDHLGSDNLWTQLRNNELGLIIGGGIVNGTEYLEDIQFGNRLENSYNNWVNPFYIFHLLNEDGKKFFYDYYEDDINLILESIKSRVDFHNKKLKEEQVIYDGVLLEIESLKTQNPKPE